MAQPEGVLRVQEDGLLQFGSRGAATKLALDTFVSVRPSLVPSCMPCGDAMFRAMYISLQACTDAQCIQSVHQL